jgi:hypothetical protein
MLFNVPKFTNFNTTQKKNHRAKYNEDEGLAKLAIGYKCMYISLELNALVAWPT